MAEKDKLNVARRPKRPEGAGLIVSYEDLARKATLFAEGKFGLLVISGPPGVSKSTTLKRALRDAGREYCFVEANASAFGCYCLLWQNRNKLVLIDDADSIHQDPAGRRLLKQLCQTEQWRRLSWDSKATRAKKSPAPPEFWSSSKVCILTNSWNYGEGNTHAEAVEDRGHCYAFGPTAMEVHKYIAGWFWDQPIFDFVARHLPYLKRPSCRLYIKAAEQKAAGEDWKKYVLGHVFTEGDPEYRLIELINDGSFASNTARAKAFVSDGYGSRATFYRYLADLEERRGLEEVPHIAVQGQPPEDQPDPQPPEEDETDDEDDEE